MGGLRRVEGVENKRKAESATYNAEQALHSLCLCLKSCAVSALPAAFPPKVRGTKVSSVCSAQHYAVSEKTAENMTQPSNQAMRYHVAWFTYQALSVASDSRRWFIYGFLCLRRDAGDNRLFLLCKCTKPDCLAHVMGRYASTEAHTHTHRDANLPVGYLFEMEP